MKWLDSRFDVFACVFCAHTVGFRAPYLAYSTTSMQTLKDAGYLYDSSMSEIPAAGEVGNMLYPYTLEYGTPQQCDVDCSGWRFEDLWEIPMNSFAPDERVMDNSNDLEMMKDAFRAKHGGNRYDMIGLYSDVI